MQSPFCSVEEAARKHAKADVFINYASFRRCVCMHDREGKSHATGWHAASPKACV